MDPATDIWNFLVSNGVFHTALNFAVVTLLGWLVKLIRTHIHQQREIRDFLDTEKPGGLTDVIAAQKHQIPNGPKT